MRKNAKRLVRNGRRIYGAIYELGDRREVYLAWRKHEEIYRSGKKSISDAIADNTACWAIDEDTLIRLRTEGVYLVGVAVKETGDIYLTSLWTFLDRTRAKVLNYESRGGALQRYLPISEFRVLWGKTRFKMGRKRKTPAVT